MTVNQLSRRGFLELGTATGAAVLTRSQWVHAAGSDILRIGLVGCGGRGSGSLLDSLTAMPNVRVVALGDLFREKAVATRTAIAASDVGRGRIDVPDERIFTGFDSYKGVIAESDVVHIALPSRFHPPYNLAAVQAGKHAFTEKPNGIDADGVHVTIQAAEIAQEKKLANVSGLCYRYDLLRRQAIERIRNGEIGEIMAVQCDYLRTPYHLVEKKPEWSEAEYQIRNWEHFTWLNGDEIQQSLLHNLDSVLWALGDELPETCYALGGRSSVFRPAFGDLFDHASVIYDYTDGKRIYGATRTADNCLFQQYRRLARNQRTHGLQCDRNSVHDRHARERTMACGRKRPDSFDVRAGTLRSHQFHYRGQADQRRIPHGQFNDGRRPRHDCQFHRQEGVVQRPVRESLQNRAERRQSVVRHASRGAGPNGLYRIPVPGEYQMKAKGGES